MQRAHTQWFAALSAFAVAGAAMADWNPGDPFKMHYPQLPDLTPEGMDVNASFDPAGAFNGLMILADDFRCNETGLITDVHVWGSWLDDVIPTVLDPNNPIPTPITDPAAARVVLSIHSDIPVDPPNVPYSRPGDLLWEKVFEPNTYVARVYADGLQEGWYDPLANRYLPVGDTVCWQYNFFIDEAEAFLQEKDTIYWLNVAVIPEQDITGATPQFGWKSSQDHFNDDAVWATTDPANWPLPQTPWEEMRYPDGHPFHPQSVDLAFVITPEPGMLLLSLAGLATLLPLRRR